MRKLIGCHASSLTDSKAVISLPCREINVVFHEPIKFEYLQSTSILTGSAGIHLGTLMYWFNKNLDIRTFSVFRCCCWPPLSVLPSSRGLNSGWHKQCGQGCSCLHPLLPCSSWVLQMSPADWYCVLQFIWQIAFVAFDFSYHSNSGNRRAVSQIQIPYIWKDRAEDFCVESGLYPKDLFVNFTENCFERNLG